MAEPYRFGGPIPDSVQHMKLRRALRRTIPRVQQAVLSYAHAGDSITKISDGVAVSELVAEIRSLRSGLAALRPVTLHAAVKKTRRERAEEERASHEILRRWDAEGMPPRRVSPDPDDESRRGKTPDEVFDSVESLVDASRSCARVVLDLRVDGSVLIVATCCGVPDSKYAPMAAERVPVEVSKLLTELRNRVVNLRASR